MKKIAIVGVEGSGKTVLMSVLGEAYQSPDANGVFLKALNHATFEYYQKVAGELRKGDWPMATESGVLRLDWELKRKSSGASAPETLGQLSFLDFGGEIYRLAFGKAAGTELDEERAAAVEQLKAHMEGADALVVLVNLSDMINNPHADDRTIEMKWLTLEMLSYVFDKALAKRVALVFTQSDAYGSIIESLGGARGALARYLPSLAANYGHRLTVFPVAAVGQTVPADHGGRVPAQDFEPSGLDALMDWIVASVYKPRRRHGCGCLLAVIVLALVGLGAFYKLNPNFASDVDDFCEHLRDAIFGGAGGESASPEPEQESQTPLSVADKTPEFLDACRTGRWDDAAKVMDSADKTNSDVQFYLGYMHLYGKGGVQEDNAEALKWCRKAVEQGNARAQCQLGTMHYFGWGVDKNYQEAAKWYRKGVEGEGGFWYELCNLGAIYENGGFGVEKNYTEAMKWYRVAAEGGCNAAQFKLGDMYYQGHGVDKDFNEAEKWFRKAAEEGHAEAQCNLGSMYLLGRGVQRNREEAIKWYRKAAEQGNKAAKEILRKLGVAE